MAGSSTIAGWKQGVIAVAVAAGAAVNLTVVGWALWVRPALNTDFMAFWSFPRFARDHAVAGIYDAARLQGFQQALYPGFHSFYPYLYPPTFLLASWWLNFLSFAAAQAVWTVLGLALLVAAGWRFFPARYRRVAVVAMLASPAALLSGATGETAFFTTALLLSGFAALPRRPVLAGIAFGLLTLKPQLGVLVPVALLARGAWRAMAVAALVAAALVALSCLALPPGLWAVWARTLPVYQSQYFNGHGLNLNILVTPAANLVALGVAPGVAWAVQVVVAALVAALVWRCFRRGPYGLAVAALLVGGLLAVPHAYAYDSVTLSAALALLLAGRRPLPAPLPDWLLGLGLVVYLAPWLLLTPAAHWFFYALPETLLFAAIIPLALGEPKRAVWRDELEPADGGAGPAPL